MKNYVRRPMIRALLALVVGVSLVAGSFVPQLPDQLQLEEGEALAADASVASCDEASFDAALATVQGSGGGTITFSCTGTIGFTSQKTITSTVTIIGNGGVIFDGGNRTRLFQVDPGATLELADLVLRNGNAATGDGGAIRNSGTLMIMSSTFRNNIGGRGDFHILRGRGGAIHNGGTLTIVASTFSNNGAEASGAINNRGRLEITASTFSSNRAAVGGAISNFGTVTINASTFSVNNAAVGGAIYNSDGILHDLDGTVAITTSTFSGNSAGIGGAIHTDFGTLTITSSLLSGNSASSGGAIYNRQGRATITASTLSGNSADDSGGAIRNSGTLEITASTLSGNSASEGGAIYDSFGTVAIGASIVANSPTGDNCFEVLADDITSLGSNLSDEASCPFTATGDIPNSTAINLGALADNGGPTQTMLPGAGSDAIDAADCSLSSAQDQRGADRPNAPATTCDIGAVEVGATVPVQLIAVYSTSGTIDEGGSATFEAVAYGPDNGNLTYAFDCNNNGDYETPGTGSGTTGTASCRYPIDGIYTVGVQVCDGADAGNCDTGTTTVTVNNVAPEITSIEVSAESINEGEQVTVSGTFSDPGSFDLHFCTATWSDGVVVTVGCSAHHPNFTTTRTFFDDDPQSGTPSDDFTVTIELSDSDLAVDSAVSPVITVNNVAPTVDEPVVDIEPSEEGQSVVASAGFTDPGTNDTHRCTVDYGDGSGVQDGTVEGLTCTGPAHTYVDDDPSGTDSDPLHRHGCGE